MHVNVPNSHGASTLAVALEPVHDTLQGRVEVVVPASQTLEGDGAITIVGVPQGETVSFSLRRIDSSSEAMDDALRPPVPKTATTPPPTEKDAGKGECAPPDKSKKRSCSKDVKSTPSAAPALSDGEVVKRTRGCLKPPRKIRRTMTPLSAQEEVAVQSVNPPKVWVKQFGPEVRLDNLEIINDLEIFIQLPSEKMARRQESAMALGCTQGALVKAFANVSHA